MTLLMSFAAAGVALLATTAADVVRSRTGRALTTLIACAGIASAALVLDVHMDLGRFGVIVVLPFLGLPAWVAAMSVRLVRGCLLVDSVPAAPAPARHIQPA